LTLEENRHTIDRYRNETPLPRRRTFQIHGPENQA
jgi:hypothetical protein